MFHLNSKRKTKKIKNERLDKKEKQEVVPTRQGKKKKERQCLICCQYKNGPILCFKMSWGLDRAH